MGKTVTEIANPEPPAKLQSPLELQGCFALMEGVLKDFIQIGGRFGIFIFKGT